MNWLRSLLLLVLVAAPTLAEDWPQWLGPRRDGTSKEKIVPWKGDLKIAWKKPVGPGHSSPVIVGGKVYLFSQVAKKEEEQLAAFDAKTGKPLWQTPYKRGFFKSPFGTGPQSTPTVVKGKVYTFGATGFLTCFDAEKGTQLWQVDTWKKFNVTKENKRRLVFGAACSPLVVDGKVIVNVGGEGASVVAFSADKGDVVWKQLDDNFSYASPVVFGTGKARQVLALTAEGLRGFGLEKGEVNFKFPFTDKLNESSTTPVQMGNVILLSSITSGSIGVELTTKGGKTTAKEVWKQPKVSCYFSTPVAADKDHLYLVSGRIVFPSSTLHCLNMKTGKLVWSKPKVGKYHAALLRTANNKFLMLSDNGNLILLDPDVKEYKELCRSQIVKGEQIWAHPALSNGRVYLRDEKELICVEVPQE